MLGNFLTQLNEKGPPLIVDFKGSKELSWGIGMLLCRTEFKLIGTVESQTNNFWKLDGVGPVDNILSTN